MEFKTELHCHSHEISPCSSESAEEVAEKYIKNGYTTLVLTNHATAPLLGNVCGWDTSFEERINRFFDAVDNVRQAASGRLYVLDGMEIGFNENGNDYLVFGITKQFCLEHPDMFEMDHWHFHKLANEHGMLFIQAHPFRYGITTVSPDAVDGYEIFNGHPRQHSHNAIAEAWAKHFTKHDLIFTSGTDNHDGYMVPNAGIITKEPIVSNEELLKALRSRKYEIIRSPLGDAEY